MSFRDKTAAELALELKVKDLERELHYYRQKERYESDGMIVPNPADIKEISMDYLSPRLELHKTAEINAKLDAYEDRLEVMARTLAKPSSKQIGLAWYSSRPELETTRDKVQLLGFMHERFMRDLAHFLKENT